MEPVSVACDAAASPGFAEAWGSAVTPASLRLRVWAHWPTRARLALLLRERPDLRPEALSPALLAALDAPPAALLAEACRAVPAPAAALALAPAEMEADMRSLASADALDRALAALDRALAALGATAREEGADEWERVAGALADTTALLAAVDALAAARGTLAQDAAALAEQASGAEP